MSLAPNESRFALLPSDAIDDPELTLADIRVLGVIGYHAGRKRPAWPKQKTIALRLGLTRETVNRSIRRLHRKGYIDIAHQFDDAGGQRESCYFVRLDPDLEVQPVEVLVRGKPLSLVPRVTQKSLGESDGPVTPGETPSDHTPHDLQTSHLKEHPKGTSQRNNTPNPKGNGSAKSSESDKPEITAAVRSEFDGLWKLWPDVGRKRSKAKDLCLAQFARSCREVSPTHVVEAAAAFVRKQNPEFTPGLDKWLRDRKFEHFLPQAAELPLEPRVNAANPPDRDGNAVDWDAAVAKYVRSRIWPRQLGDRPDDLGYRGPLRPLETIMANGRFGDLDVKIIRMNIDRLRADSAA